MRNIRKTTTIIATVAAVLSLGMAFMPQAMAGTAGSTLEVNLAAGCGIGANDVTTSVNADPSQVNSAQFEVSLDNPGTGTLEVFANIGDALQDTSASGDPNVGGFADGTRQLTTDVHILPQDVTFDANDPIGVVSMLDNGNDIQIADLGPTSPEGEGGPRQVLITADLTNLQNLPATGLQTADVTFTGGLCT